MAPMCAVLCLACSSSCTAHTCACNHMCCSQVQSKAVPSVTSVLSLLCLATLMCRYACTGARQKDAMGAHGGRRRDGAQCVAAARVCPAHGVPLQDNVSSLPMQAHGNRTQWVLMADADVTVHNAWRLRAFAQRMVFHCELAPTASCNRCFRAVVRIPVHKYPMWFHKFSELDFSSLRVE